MVPAWSLLVRDIACFRARRYNHYGAFKNPPGTPETNHHREGKQLHRDDANLVEDEPRHDRNTQHARARDDFSNSIASDGGRSFIKHTADKVGGLLVWNVLPHQEFDDFLG